jgi:hypothetical protein
VERGEFEGFSWRRGMADMEVGDEGVVVLFVTWLWMKGVGCEF